jgi:hypothetical protein
VLGHAQISVTMDIYSHVLPGMQQELANKLNEMLGGSSGVGIEEELRLVGSVGFSRGTPKNRQSE